MKTDTTSSDGARKAKVDASLKRRAQHPFQSKRKTTTSEEQNEMANNNDNDNSVRHMNNNNNNNNNNKGLLDVDASVKCINGRNRASF